MMDDAAPEKIPPNPFDVPKMELNPQQPLAPWRVPEHEHYYVPVDDTQTAYDRFQAKVNHDALTLRDHGRLLTVLGGTGCGKTSLLNRCVGWMQDRLTVVGVEPFVLECRDVIKERTPVELKERMNVVCRRVVTRARSRLRLDETFVAELREYESRPADLYDCLAEVLQAISHSMNAVLIILLPDTDLAEEIVEYAQLVHPRLVFCVESTAVGRPIRWSRRVQAGAAPPIELRVSPLGPNDASLFANKRLAGHHSAGHHSGTEMPTVGEDVMAELSGSPAAATIAGLVGLMRGIYAEKLSQPPPYSRVTMQDVERYLLRALANWTMT